MKNYKKTLLKRISIYSIIIMMFTNFYCYPLRANAAISGNTVITIQPEDQKGVWGSRVQFHVKASGSNLKYQWQYRYDGKGWHNTSMIGYNTDTLSVDVNDDRVQRKYRCVVTGDEGTVISEAAGLTAVKTIEIMEQPKDQKGVWGSRVQFHVKASGSNLKYQWQYRYDGKGWHNTAMTGYNTDTLSVDVNDDRVQRKYRCVVTGDEGTVTSAAAGLTGVKTVEITEQPKDQKGVWGSRVQFHVKASGSNLKYQWQYRYDGKGWHNTSMIGYNTDTLSVDVNDDRVQRKYRCVVTGDEGAVTSTAAGLTAVETIEITEQPKDQEGVQGSTAEFHVEASGSNLKYQWQCSYDGEDWSNTNLPGYDTDTLLVTVNDDSLKCKYRCVISNDYEKKTSDVVGLTQIEVIPSISLTNSGNDHVADGQSFTLQAVTDNAVSIQWQTSTDGSNFEDISGETGESFTYTNSPAPSEDQIVYYRAVATSSTGNTAGSNVIEVLLLSEDELPIRPQSNSVESKVAENPESETVSETQAAGTGAADSETADKVEDKSDSGVENNGTGLAEEL